MVQKVVKEVVQNLHTGEVAIEYFDGTEKSYNIDSLPVASIVSGNTVLDVFGTTIDVAGSSQSAIETAQAIATVTGDFIVGETVTVNLPTGWTGSYQWTRSGVDIAGATSPEYLIDAADEGATISCTVTDLVYSTVGGIVITE